MKRKDVASAAKTIRTGAGGSVDCAIVLGSGIGETFEKRITGSAISYGDISGLPKPPVAGHSGRAIIGSLAGRSVIAFSGRFHLYEGYDAEDVVSPVELAVAAGAKTVLLTNAAGGLAEDFAAGDIMLITDHLNLTGHNPLTGRKPLHGIENRFVDMIDAYDRALRETALRVAAEEGITLKSGVYAGLAGPSYETRAEAAMLRTLGAAAVGMSTVLETIAAKALGARVLACSVISNMVGAPTTHDEVLSATSLAADRLVSILERVLADANFPPVSPPA